MFYCELQYFFEDILILKKGNNMKTSRFIFTIIVLSLPIAIAFAQYNNVRLTTNAYDQSEPAIAVSPLNSNYLFSSWNDFRSDYFSQAGYAFSTDKGVTWGDNVVPAHNNYTYGFDPSVAFDRYGNAYLCYVASAGDLGPIYVSRTTTFQQNATWNRHQQVSSLTYSQDKPYLAVDNTIGTYDGRIYVSWTDFSSGSAIKFAYSTDHGDSFTNVGSLSSLSGSVPEIALAPSSSIQTSYPQASAVQGSVPAVGPNGDVYVVWMEINSGYNGSYLKIKKSTNGGTSFGSLVTVAAFTFQRTNVGYADVLNLPTIAVDPATGYVYVSYTDQVSQYNSNLRIKWVRSTNGGSSWSSPVIIADFGTGQQFFPWMCVDETGRISLVLTHSVNSTTVDTYIIESLDHGLGFLSPVKVNSQSSNPNNSSWTHHYQGIATRGGGISCPVWTDYRNGNADIYFGYPNPAPPQNVASASQSEIRITWTANSEPDFQEYQVWRSINSQGGPPGTFCQIATVTTNSFTDEDLGYGSRWKVYYRIKAKNTSGITSPFSSMVTVGSSGFIKRNNQFSDNSQPSNFVLRQNFPNPFNPSTTIKYQTPSDGYVILKVYNQLGSELVTLVNGYKAAGYYEVNFNASILPSGIYTYRLTAGENYDIRKMTLMK